ncbi:hypothetical protein D3C71_2193950 [compost metagenome]
MELNPTASVTRFLTQIPFNHLNIMGYHQEGHMVMGMHMEDQLEEVRLGLYINPHRRLIKYEQIRMIN